MRHVWAQSSTLSLTHLLTYMLVNTSKTISTYGNSHYGSLKKIKHVSSATVASIFKKRVSLADIPESKCKLQSPYFLFLLSF